jgi:hypothetical protein
MKTSNSKAPNPNGKHGKPIVLPPTTFEDAVKKMLTTPSPESKPKKKPASPKK